MAQMDHGAYLEERCRTGRGVSLLEEFWSMAVDGSRPRADNLSRPSWCKYTYFQGTVRASGSAVPETQAQTKAACSRSRLDEQKCNDSVDSRMSPLILPMENVLLHRVVAPRRGASSPSSDRDSDNHTLVELKGE